MVVCKELSECSELSERLRLRFTDEAGIELAVVLVPDGPDALWGVFPRDEWAEIVWVVEFREVEMAGWSEANGVGGYWGVSSARTNR